jgi:hypothetical protein
VIVSKKQRNIYPAAGVSDDPSLPVQVRYTVDTVPSSTSTCATYHSTLPGTCTMMKIYDSSRPGMCITEAKKDSGRVSRMKQKSEMATD